MEITFVANARIAGYRAGQVYKIDSKDLTPLHRALLAKGRHLALLDPLSLDEENEDGGGKSTDTPKSSGQASPEGNADRAKTDGGKRPTGSKEDSPGK